MWISTDAGYGRANGLQFACAVHTIVNQTRSLNFGLRLGSGGADGPIIRHHSALSNHTATHIAGAYLHLREVNSGKSSSHQQFCSVSVHGHDVSRSRI